MADVLVVDDDGDLTEIVEIVLESAGHCVRRAADGLEGLARMRERLPDVVLLDVEMPRLSGPEMAYRMFVEDAGKERVPVVLLSGAVGLEHVAQQVGTPYFLAKPCETRCLTDLLARAVREHRAPMPAR